MGDDGFGCVDAVDFDAALCEGQRDPACADAEFEGGAVACEIREGVRGGTDVGAHGVHAVIDFGDFVAVGCGGVVVHEVIPTRADRIYRMDRIYAIYAVPEPPSALWIRFTAHV